MSVVRRQIITFGFCLIVLSPAMRAHASVYCDYDLASMTGTSLLIDIENEMSINDDGQAAFIGDQNASFDRQIGCSSGSP